MDASGARAAGSGHRLLAHTADLLIEGWGPTLPDCISQAVTGLVESFADISHPPVGRPLAFAFEPAPEDELVVRLLDEVIYLVEVFQVVPVRTTARRTAEGGLAGEFDVVPVSQTRLTGPLPKGASWNDLRCESDGTRWWCLVTVDV